MATPRPPSQHDFLWEGRDAEGERRRISVTARTAQAARAQLEQVGWTGLRLITDETTSVSKRQVKMPEWLRDDEDVDTVADAYQGRLPKGFLAIWMHSLRGAGLWVLGLAGLTAFGIYTSSPIPAWLAGLALSFLVFLSPVVQLLTRRTHHAYLALVSAKEWGRWEEALQWVQRLRHSRLSLVAIGETELLRSEAQALAALGRLEEAVSAFRRLEGSPELPHWLYLSHLGSVYDAGKAPEHALACRRQAAAENPDSAAMWIDLAQNLADGLNRPQEAREAMNRAVQLEITELGRPYVPLIRGMIAWREADFPTAREELEEAVSLFEAMPPDMPYRQGVIAFAKSFLCAVECQAGRLSVARKLYPECQRYLEAHRRMELQEICRPAAGR